MEIKCERKDLVVVICCLTVMYLCGVLAAVYIGHRITAMSQVPISVQVLPSTANIDVKVPPQNITVNPSMAKVEVNIPQSLPPIVHVATPTPAVTVIERQIQTPIKVEEPKAQPQAETKPEEKKSSEVRPDDNLDTLYAYAERYINVWCRHHDLDPNKEAAKWSKAWQTSLEQAVADDIDSGEQSYINRIVVQKRDCFNLEKATPEQIVEGCRLLLRYRDGQLMWLQAMRDAVTTDNLKKTITFLSAGPQ